MTRTSLRNTSSATIRPTTTRCEIFINPNPQEVVYYGFEMNARGVLCDYLNYNSRAVQALRYHRREDRDVLRGSLNVRSDTDSGWASGHDSWPNLKLCVVHRPWARLEGDFNRWDGVEPKPAHIWSDPLNTESWPRSSRFSEIVFVG